MSLPDTSFLKDMQSYRDRRRSTQKKNQKKLFWGHLMQGLAGQLNDARKTAREDFKTEQAKADRNLKFVVEKENERKAMEGIAQNLKTYGIDNNAIMYYAKDGPESLKNMNTRVSQLISDMRQTGIEPDNEIISEFLNIPIDFKPEDKELSTFFDEMYSNYKNLNEVDPPKDPVGFLENAQLAASGITGQGAYRRKIQDEKYYGDYTIADINRIAMQSGTTADPFGGAFKFSALDETALPRILDADDVARYQLQYETEVKKQLTDSPTQNQWLKSNVSDQLADQTGLKGEAAAQMGAEKGAIYEAFVEDTRRRVASEFVDRYNLRKGGRVIMQQLSNMTPYLMETDEKKGDVFLWDRQGEENPKMSPTAFIDENNINLLDNIPNTKALNLDKEYKDRGFSKGMLVRVISAAGLEFIELGKNMKQEEWDRL